MKNQNRKLSLASLALIFTFAIPLQAQGTDYYIDTNNVGANDSNSGTSSQPWKTITKANQTLVAGDTVFIKEGTYSTYINPSNSGTSGNRITYRNYGTDTVTISGTTYTVYLNGDSYVTVDGIKGTNSTQFLYIINGSNYNIIANSSFDSQSPPGWDVSAIYGDSQYNWIHHNQFSKGGECTAGGSDDGSVLEIGIEGSFTDLTRYNLFEDNVFFHGGHHVVGLFGGYNTFRNNYLHNEEWSRSRGNRTLYMNGRSAVTGHNIVEGNRFGYAARPCDDFTVGNVSMSTQNNIFRYNKLYHPNAYAIGTWSYSGYSNAQYNMIYNNTIFNTGYNIYPSYERGSEDTAIAFLHSSNANNQLKNNLYYSNFQVYTGFTGNQFYDNEFDGDTQGDPLFVNASTTPPADKTDSSLPNLDLQTGSPAIDAGGTLTTVAAVDTGSGASLIVSDADYFQDGTYAPSGTSQGDWIAVGTVGNIVQISSINYSTNTITLANSISRIDNDPVWLYKKSDGDRVLYGTSPDAGAYEYRGFDTLAPSAPQNLAVN